MSKYFHLSRDINKDYFDCNLNALFSFKSIENFSKFALWPSNNIWSKIADFLGVSANLPVKGVIPRRLEALIKNVFVFDHNKLRGSKLQMNWSTI